MADQDITDTELEAATLAYVGQRYAKAGANVGSHYTKPEEWRERFPQAWLETRDRMRAALLAAAAVRAQIDRLTP